MGNDVKKSFQKLLSFLSSQIDSNNDKQVCKDLYTKIESYAATSYDEHLRQFTTSFNEDDFKDEFLNEAENYYDSYISKLIGNNKEQDSFYDDVDASGLTDDLFDNLEVKLGCSIGEHIYDIGFNDSGKIDELEDKYSPENIERQNKEWKKEQDEIERQHNNER
jgi:hypothetical protein